MELWLDERFKMDSIPEFETVFDRRIGVSSSSEDTLTVEDGIVKSGEQVVGGHVLIKDDLSQNHARSMIGSVEWLLVEFTDWSMIPIENLIAACEGTPTKIAAIITKTQQAHGAGFALQKGVDALVVRCDSMLIEEAMVVKSQRTEREHSLEEIHDHNSTNGLQTLTITSIENGDTAERYCIDMTRLLNHGEGLLLGSSASSLVLVHGETLDSEFVPPRPFRVNAGPPHAYVTMANGKTKYLAELNTGDQVLLTSTDGKQRNATIGRLKIEIRPMLILNWVDENNKEGCMFLQQAETVRVIGQDCQPLSVTELKKGDVILGWSQKGARHIGVSISSSVSER